MSGALQACSIAAAATSAFAFRFDASRSPVRLASYFLGIASVEWLASRVFLPAGALPVEVAYTCLAIAALFTVASFVRDRLTGGSRGT